MTVRFHIRIPYTRPHLDNVVDAAVEVAVEAVRLIDAELGRNRLLVAADLIIQKLSRVLCPFFYKLFGKIRGHL